MADLPEHWRFLEDAWQTYRRSPLSARKAMLVVTLADALVDRLFESARDEDDILSYRSRLGIANPALAVVMTLAAHRPEGPRFILKDQQVPLERYGALPVEDFMVSLYNDHSVQRLMLVQTGMQDVEAEQLLSGALSELGRLIP